LWDDFSGHLTGKVTVYAAYIQVTLLNVPPHATPVSQPADVAWNLPLKARLRQFWHQDIQAQIKATRDSRTKFKLKRPGRAKISSWVRSAWNDLPSSTIANHFRTSRLTPSDNCVVAASLIADLERFSLLEGHPVGQEQDFDRLDIVEEAFV
jgi:hypothetical protein